MDKVQAEESIKLIRDVMERSTRYMSFSGVSGVIVGTLAIIGCVITYWVALNTPLTAQPTWYTVIWSAVLLTAAIQDLALAQRKARRRGTTIWVPATYQVLKAAVPGILVAFVLTLNALRFGEFDVIPAIWTLCYGAVLSAVGMFSAKEVRVFGVVQLITGTIGLFWFSTPPESLYLLALTFGVYHIIYGLIMTRKYGW